ncbi:hypothetical protein JTE90_020293 [Oedothorax gibbosus]|uniref:Uncharacterized protein n=1 Tax=Oedothorax gibbosus TaxID=931172 RepID=A0AAV6VP81_9ARAC|nr:hypothetical protein JTE90_020293 [Oedothorax gibbosus]
MFFCRFKTVEITYRLHNLRCLELNDTRAPNGSTKDRRPSDNNEDRRVVRGSSARYFRYLTLKQRTKPQEPDAAREERHGKYA